MSEQKGKRPATAPLIEAAMLARMFIVGLPTLPPATLLKNGAPAIFFGTERFTLAARPPRLLETFMSPLTPKRPLLFVNFELLVRWFCGSLE